MIVWSASWNWDISCDNGYIWLYTLVPSGGPSGTVSYVNSCSGNVCTVYAISEAMYCQASIFPPFCNYMQPQLTLGLRLTG